MKGFGAGFALVLLLTSCAVSSGTPAEQQSTAGHIVTTDAGSRGSVFFVSDQVGWVFTIPPDGLRTVVFRTGDGGSHWRLWGIAPTVASGPLGLGADEVVLQGHGCPAQCDQQGILRSSDGAHWSFATTPTGDTPFFLPDLQHGWVFGFVPEPPCNCLPQGKGGPPAPPSPSGLWYTSDGGASWRMQMQGYFGDLGGQPAFWNTDDGLLVQPPVGAASVEAMWSTHDGGVSWHPLTSSFPPPLSSQAFVTASQLTIFDQSHGLLALRAAQTTLYISETSDAGRTWSTPRDMTSCLECSGQVFYLNSKRWLAYDKSFFITSDAGTTWHSTYATITAKSMSAVEVTRLAPGTVVALEPGVIASMTTDWGAHWRVVGLPQIYQSYHGFNGSGGSTFCCI
jgi:photosystem II stability/assembly factor-like uncharacterized protein